MSISLRPVTFLNWQEKNLEERRILSIGATGNAVSPSVHAPGRPYSFFDLGRRQALLSAFELRSYFDSATSESLRPGRSARAMAEGQTVAVFGQLHPDVAIARKLKQEIYIAELYL